MSVDAKILGPKGPPHVFHALGRSFEVRTLTRATKVGFQKHHMNKLIRDLEPTKEFTTPDRYQQKLDAIVDDYEAGSFRFETIFTKAYLHSEDGICELTAYMMQCTEDEAADMIKLKGPELSTYLRLTIREGRAEPHHNPDQPVAVTAGGDVAGPN